MELTVYVMDIQTAIILCPPKVIPLITVCNLFYNTYTVFHNPKKISDEEHKEKINVEHQFPKHFAEKEILTYMHNTK